MIRNDCSNWNLKSVVDKLIYNNKWNRGWNRENDMFYVLICTQLAVCGRTEVSGCTQRHRRSPSDCPYITLTEWLLRKERHECIPIEGSVKHKCINGQNVAIVLKGNNVFKHLFPFVCFLYSVKLQGNHKINKSSSCDEYTLLF